MPEAPRELEAFIDEGLRLARARGFPNAGFVQMRRRYGTMEAITRLVTSGEIKGGLVRMIELDLADWTIDAAVVGRFREYFPAAVREGAAWRLAEAKARCSRTVIRGREEP